MQKFKEIPHQNYIELRFNNKNVSQLNEEEALVRYKRNSAVLGKIFSFERGEPSEEEIRQPAASTPTTHITQQSVNRFYEEVERDQQISKQKVEQAHHQSKLFEQLVGNSQRIRTEQDLKNLLQTLKDNNMYDESHPFLNVHSPFHMNTTQAEMLPVQLKQHLQQSNFSEQGMIFEEVP